MAPALMPEASTDNSPGFQAGVSPQSHRRPSASVSINRRSAEAETFRALLQVADL
jgi:hypothetical protein